MNNKKLTTEFTFASAGAAFIAALVSIGTALYVDATSGNFDVVALTGAGVALGVAAFVEDDGDIKTAKKWLKYSVVASVATITISFANVVGSIVSNSTQPSPETIELITQGANKKDIKDAIAPSIKTFVNDKTLSPE